MVDVCVATECVSIEGGTPGCSAIQVVNAFLDEAKRNGDGVSLIKLQKLVYYAHGWHLAIFNCPFIDEGIEAGKYGPVVKSLYNEFQEFGMRAITTSGVIHKFVHGNLVSQEPTITPGHDKYMLVNKVWKVYGRYSSIQLANETHAGGTPWREIFDHFKGIIPPNINIPDEWIRSHFGTKMDERF